MCYKAYYCSSFNKMGDLFYCGCYICNETALIKSANWQLEILLYILELFVLRAGIIDTPRCDQPSLAFAMKFD